MKPITRKTRVSFWLKCISGSRKEYHNNKSGGAKIKQNTPSHDIYEHACGKFPNKNACIGQYISICGQNFYGRGHAVGICVSFCKISLRRSRGTGSNDIHVLIRLKREAPKEENHRINSFNTIDGYDNNIIIILLL